MALSRSFDVTKNLSGLSGININEPIVERKPVEPPKEKPAPIKEEKVIKKPKKEPTPQVSTPVKDIDLSGLSSPAKKERLTMHKNFLMTEKRYNQFKELAKQRNQSENALFNDLLTMVFGEE